MHLFNLLRDRARSGGHITCFLFDKDDNNQNRARIENELYAHNGQIEFKNTEDFDGYIEQLSEEYSQTAKD